MFLLFLLRPVFLLLAMLRLDHPRCAVLLRCILLLVKTDLHIRLPSDCSRFVCHSSLCTAYLLPFTG